jgi:hypothetical protein
MKSTTKNLKQNNDNQRAQHLTLTPLLILILTFSPPQQASERVLLA